MKKPMKKRLYTLAATLLLLLAGSLIWSFKLCYDALHAPYDPRVYETMGERYPGTAAWLDSIERSGAVRDAALAGDNGDTLHALFIPARRPTDRTAVLLHGYQGAGEAMMMIGCLYHRDLGFNILLPDLRGHAATPGAIEMGWMERGEIIRWIRKADELFGCQTRVVLHGISMGAAATMIAASEPSLPDNVLCAVEDCGYTSSMEAFAQGWRNQTRIPCFPLLNLSSMWCKLLYGWSFSESSPLARIPGCRIPMLFIHGEEDSLLPVEMARRLYAAKNGEKELWTLPGVDHGAAYLCAPEEYTARTKAFVERYIP